LTSGLEKYLLSLWRSFLKKNSLEEQDRSGSVWLPASVRSAEINVTEAFLSDVSALL
jgi:hypothetical protein